MRPSREVQLKNRFKKWDVKKYIPDDDLRVMLSLKRKRQRLGKDARFQYKGHDVEQERMERAWKRQRGPLQSPDCEFQSLGWIAGLKLSLVVPSYIKMYTSRQHSPQDALSGASLNSTDRQSIAPQIFDMPLLEQYQTRGSPNVAFRNPFEFDFDFNFDIPPVMQESDDHRVAYAGQISGDLVMAEAPIAAPLQIEGADFWGDVISSTEMQGEHSGISRVLQDDESREHLTTTQLSRASSSQVSSIDWRRYLNFSPSMSSSSGSPAMAFQSPRYPSRPLSTIHVRTRSSPGAFLHDNTVGASPERQGSQSKTSEQFNGRLTFLASDHTDPESFMLPLQLLRSNYIESVGLARSDASILDDRGSTLDHLCSTLQSTWLSLEIEELLCRSYELSAQAIRRRQAARPVISNGTSLSLTSENDRECEPPKTGRQPIEERHFDNRRKLKLTSRTSRATSMGRLNIEFSTPPGESSYVDTSDVPFVINISSIPQSQQRTFGISAAFQNISSISRGCRISPRLRTFNVIPNDSQVIRCIRRNDILGVQRLFTEGKASPLDVDSGGFSLLSVSSPDAARETTNTNFQFSMPWNTEALICFVCFWKVEQAHKIATCKRCIPWISLENPDDITVDIPIRLMSSGPFGAFIQKPTFS